MPQLMRLKTVRTVVVGGERFEIKKWYSNFCDPKNPQDKIEVALDAYEHEVRKATVNLGKLVQDAQNGINPARKRKRLVKIGYPFQDARGVNAWEVHIKPFFGRHQARDLTDKKNAKALIEDYIESRWGRQVSFCFSYLFNFPQIENGQNPCGKYVGSAFRPRLRPGAVFCWGRG